MLRHVMLVLAMLLIANALACSEPGPGKGDGGDADAADTNPPPPFNVRVDKEASVDGIIVIQWDKVERAAKYRVYRGTQAQGPFPTLACETTETSCADKNTVADGKYDEEYHYFVEAITASGKSSNPSSRVAGSGKNLTPPKLPKLKHAKYADGRVVLTWEANKEADIKGYYVYRILEERPVPILDKYKVSDLIPHAKGWDQTWIDTNIEPGKTHSYTVVAVDKGGLKNKHSPGSRKVAYP